jgi:hypothetical protein
VKLHKRVLLYAPNDPTPHEAPLWAEVEEPDARPEWRVTMKYTYPDLSPGKGWQLEFEDVRLEVIAVKDGKLICTEA